MSAELSIALPGVDFEKMAREAIAAKLTQAMIGSDEAITKIVAAALTRKVSEKGNISTYSYENKIPYVEWLAEDLIRGATMAVLKSRVEALRPALEREVERQLTKSVKGVAKSLTESFIAQATRGYGVNVAVTAEFKTRD